MAAKLSGQGGGKYDIGANSDINVTPFVDILLVLLIVFMVSVPLATVAIKVDLPPAPLDTPADKKDPVFVSINDDGNTYIMHGPNGMERTPVTLPQLGSQLATFLNQVNPAPAKEQSVLIRADRGVKYSRFMDVVNQLQYEGYYKVGLISEDLG